MNEYKSAMRMIIRKLNIILESTIDSKIMYICVNEVEVKLNSIISSSTSSNNNTDYN